MNNEALIEYIKSHGKITVSHEPSDIPLKGNCSAVDEETDRATEEHILKELRNGNEWAWCDISVKVEFLGYVGTEYLGACSYEGEAEFKQPDGYYTDMVDTCSRDVADQLLSHRDQLMHLAKILLG